MGGDGAGDAAIVTFFDDFQRADGPLGNGWVQKQPNYFALMGGAVQRTNFSQDYRDQLVTRPASEDLLDVEVTIEFTIGHLPPGFPQVEARVQRSTLNTANTMDGYLLYINGTSGNGLSQAEITTNHGTVLPAPLVTFPLSPQLALGETYRLRLAVRGTSPVRLDGAVEHVVGTASTTIGSVSTTDTTGAPVTTAGAIGFDAGQPEAAGYYTYDHFTYTAL